MKKNSKNRDTLDKKSRRQTNRSENAEGKGETEPTQGTTDNARPAAADTEAEFEPEIVETELADLSEGPSVPDLPDLKNLKELKELEDVEEDEESLAEPDFDDMIELTHLDKQETSLAPYQQKLPEKLDTFQVYLREISRHNLLTPEEEKQISVQYWKTKDPRLALRMITSNLRLVIKIAFEFVSYTKQIMDLIQEGNYGLMQAIKHYDPFRGVKLSSYARYWIRSYMIYYLLNNFRLVKIGTTQDQRKLFFNLKKERSRLQAMGIDPTPRQLAERFEMPEKTVVDMVKRMDSPEVSIDTPRGEDHRGTIGDTIPNTENPEESIGQAQLMNLLNDKLEAFSRTIKSDREQVIWQERLIAERPLTLQEIGDRFGITRERARQLEERLKKKLKLYLYENLPSQTITLDFLN